jgi:hypothetical protein
MKTRNQTLQDWTVVLRRRPVRIVAGEPEGGYTDEYEVVCCECGDDPDLDYCQVSPQLRQIRGPYLITAGITAYVRHIGQYHSRGERACLVREAGAG